MYESRTVNVPLLIWLLCAASLKMVWLWLLVFALPFQGHFVRILHFTGRPSNLILTTYTKGFPWTFPHDHDGLASSYVDMHDVPEFELLFQSAMHSLLTMIIIDMKHFHTTQVKSTTYHLYGVHVNHWSWPWWEHVFGHQHHSVPILHSRLTCWIGLTLFC